MYNLVKKKNYQYFFLIIFLVLSSPSLVINYNKIKNSFLEDTRFTSLKWIQENLSPNEKILAGHYSPPIWNLKNFKDAKKVWFEQDFEKEKNYRIIDKTVKYIILSSSAYGRYFNSDGTLKDSSKNQGLLYLNFFEKNKLMKEFKPDYKKTTGPVIRIYINNIYKE